MKFSKIDETIAALRNLSGASIAEQRLTLLITEAPYGRRKRPRMDQASHRVRKGSTGGESSSSEK